MSEKLKGSHFARLDSAMQRLLQYGLFQAEDKAFAQQLQKVLNSETAVRCLRIDLATLLNAYTELIDAELV